MKMYDYNSRTMAMKSVTLQVFLMAIVLAVLAYLAGVIVTQERERNRKIDSLSEGEKISLIQETDPFSPEKLTEYLEELNVQHTDIVMAQAQLETNTFTSRIFQENNNLFGMKVAKVRPTTNQGEQYNHAYYRHWRESVLDYAMYQARYLSGLSRYEYLQYLGKYYAEDSNYVNKISYLSKK